MQESRTNLLQYTQNRFLQQVRPLRKFPVLARGRPKSRENKDGRTGIFRTDCLASHSRPPCVTPSPLLSSSSSQRHPPFSPPRARHSPHDKRLIPRKKCSCPALFFSPTHQPTPPGIPGGRENGGSADGFGGSRGLSGVGGGGRGAGRGGAGQGRERGGGG